MQHISSNAHTIQLVSNDVRVRYILRKSCKEASIQVLFYLIASHNTRLHSKITFSLVANQNLLIYETVSVT